MESSAGHREITAMASNHRRLDLRYATDAEEDAAEIAALVSRSGRYDYFRLTHASISGQ
jgi:hypothetical protein